MDDINHESFISEEKDEVLDTFHNFLSLPGMTIINSVLFNDPVSGSWCYSVYYYEI